jgi:hypothetical protein
MVQALSPDLCTWPWYSRENFVLKFQFNLFTTCPEGHNNYLYYSLLLQTVVDSVSIFNIPFLIKNMFQILRLPYKHPDEAEEWIVVVTQYFFWDIMLHHWVVEKWRSEAANFFRLQGVIGPGIILQGPVYPWRSGNYVASKCQELMALVYDLISDKNLSLCCATENSELVYMVVENCFSDKLWTTPSWWDMSVLSLRNDAPNHVFFLWW